MTRPTALALVVLMVTACSVDGAVTTTSPPTTSTTPTTTSTTTTTTSTSTTTTPPAVPDHYRFGPDGLSVVVDGVETVLVTEPVMAVHDDFMGGVLYRYDWALERQGTYWLAAGASEPTVLEPGFDFWFTALVGGRPTFFFADLQFDEACLEAHDLVSGIERVWYCSSGLAGQDGGLSPGSYGNDLFVGVSWMAVGGEGTDIGIVFLDRVGRPVDVDANPFPGTCTPCTLRAMISPDGLMLAYLHWPAAFWDVEGVDEDYDRAFAVWQEATADIPARVAVVDLETGAEVWELDVPSSVGLIDFDGRYLVLADDTGSTIHDTASDDGPWTVAGQLRLVRPVTPVVAATLTGDGLGVTSFGDRYDEAMAALEAALGPATVLDDPLEIDRASDGWYGGGSATSRLAAWEDHGLLVAFSDYPFFRTDGVLHFAGWTAQAGAPTRPTTVEGIGAGSTLAEARTAYGDRLVVNGDVCGPWMFLRSDPEEPSQESIVAVPGPGDGDTRVIRKLHAGSSPGC